MEKVIIQPQTIQDYLVAGGLVKALGEAGCEVTIDSPQQGTRETRGVPEPLLLTSVVLSIALTSITLLEKVAPHITRWARTLHDRHGMKVDASILGPDGKVLKKLEVPEED
jgi:hypothetical protein